MRIGDHGEAADLGMSVVTAHLDATQPDDAVVMAIPPW
jgi:hypothetical protein